MADILCTLPVPRTTQELEQTLNHYRTDDLQGEELFCCWQVIREAALALSQPELGGDRVPGDDSY